MNSSSILTQETEASAPEDESDTVMYEADDAGEDDVVDEGEKEAVPPLRDDSMTDEHEVTKSGEASAPGVCRETGEDEMANNDKARAQVTRREGCDIKMTIGDKTSAPAALIEAYDNEMTNSDEASVPATYIEGGDNDMTDSDGASVPGVCRGAALQKANAQGATTANRPDGSIAAIINAEVPGGCSGGSRKRAPSEASGGSSKKTPKSNQPQGASSQVNTRFGWTSMSIWNNATNSTKSRVR